MMTIRSFKSIFLAVWLVVLQLLSPTEAFASWLKCYVDFDTDEVIMWQSVVSFEDATHKVFLEVGWQDPHANPGSITWHHSKEDGSLSLPPLPPPPQDPDATVDPWVLMVRLHLPQALQGEDVQFVVQLVTAIADQAAEAIEFVGPTMMCDGHRASSRSAIQAVPLAWDYDLHPTLQPFTLQGAWAAGMEAVSLTPPLVLHPTSKTRTSLSTTTSTASIKNDNGNSEASQEPSQEKSGTEENLSAPSANENIATKDEL